MKPQGDFVLTAEQVAAAPPEVQRWLRGLFDRDERLNSGFILERNGFASSGDGLAICDAAEVKRLLRALADDFVACQVLFQLGCDFYNPQTGEHRGHVIEITDFINHTDVEDARSSIAASISSTASCASCAATAMRRSIIATAMVAFTSMRARSIRFISSGDGC
jgi:hypothetical protein